MERYRVEVREKTGKKIEILENFAVIERINGFDAIAVVESHIVPLYGCDIFKIPVDLHFPNFKKENDSILTIIV